MCFVASTLLVGVVALGANELVSNSNDQVALGPCPQIWAPVICDNGRVYPNQCYADRNHATGCVPWDEGL